MPFPEGVYGLLAEFDSVTSLTAAAATAYKDGWRRLDCYTPYPCEEAAEAIGFHRNFVPLITLVGGLMGCCAMFLMETWINVWAYPLNIGGRPYYSWPAFIVPAYEWTILFAGLTAGLAAFHSGSGVFDKARYNFLSLLNGREVTLAQDYFGFSYSKDLTPLIKLELYYLEPK